MITNKCSLPLHTAAYSDQWPLHQVPAPFDLEAVMKSKASDPSALHVVLLQEVERYNSLLVRLRSSCSQVQAGLKGLVVMSADLDEIADALFNAKVQPPWRSPYASHCIKHPMQVQICASACISPRLTDSGCSTEQGPLPSP